MKLLVPLLSLLLTLPTPAFAALGAATAWEVRTTGDNLNGAGYNSGNATPGTDYSQSDTANDTGTDLASTDGDAVPCVVTSASHNFVDADEGNIIRIHEAGTGAFTLGYYEVVSTSSNAATLDRACGANGALSGGDWNLGGAAADPEQVTAAVVAGNTVWIKAGTYNVILNTDTAGAGTTPILWYGYNASRGDNPTGTSRPLLNGGSARANCIVSDVADQAYRNLRCASATGDGISYTNSGVQNFWNVSSTSNGGDGWDDSATNADTLRLYQVESGSNSLTGITSDAGSTVAFRGVGLYIHDNTGKGISAADPSFLALSAIEGNGGDGWGGTVSDAVGFCVNVVSYGNTGGTSDGYSGFGSGALLVNCVGNSNGQYGFEGDVNEYPLFDHNGYNGNVTALEDTDWAGPNDVTSDPSFTNPGSGDFTISSGSSYLATGFPQSEIPGLTGDYQMNIGLDQDDNVTASSTDLLGVFQ